MFSMVLVTGATIGGWKAPWETQKSDSQTGLMWLLHTLVMVTGFIFKVNFRNYKWFCLETHLQTRLQTYSGTLIIDNVPDYVCRRVCRHIWRNDFRTNLSLTSSCKGLEMDEKWGTAPPLPNHTKRGIHRVQLPNRLQALARAEGPCKRLWGLHFASPS